MSHYVVIKFFITDQSLQNFVLKSNFCNFCEGFRRLMLVPLTIYFEKLGYSPNVLAPWNFYKTLKKYQHDLHWILEAHKCKRIALDNVAVHIPLHTADIGKQNIIKSKQLFLFTDKFNSHQIYDVWLLEKNIRG